MRIDVISLFPDYFLPLNLSLLGRAQHAGLIEVTTHDLRDFTRDRHRSVDDSPYGGGPGMVLRPEPWGAAIDHVVESAAGTAASGQSPLMLIPTPAGEPFNQFLARRWSTEAWLLIGCGRYEGIDQRVIEDTRPRMRVFEVSIGDYVVNGGEVAALAIIEAVARLVPGVIGNDESLVQESHSEGLLEAPSYTKPELWRRHPVPSVLLSGHHLAIDKWRREQSLRRTAATRPDLILALDPSRVTADDRAVLRACGWAITAGRFSLAPGPVAD